MRKCLCNAAAAILVIGLAANGPASAVCGDDTTFSIDGEVETCDALMCNAVSLTIGDPVAGFLTAASIAAGPNSTFTQTDISLVQFATGDLLVEDPGTDAVTAALTTDASGEIASGTVSLETEVDTGIGIANVEIDIDATTGTWAMETTFLGIGVFSEGSISFARNLDTDGDGQPDTCDPDDDNDCIGDALDNQPLVSDNNCTTNNGTNATLVGTTISAQQLTCASKETVDVSGTTNVGIDGYLRLISEKVSLTDTSVTDNGRMEVINADPCPGCVFPCPTAPALFQLGVPVADFQALFDQLVANGFRPVWIDGYRSGGQSFINAIFDETQVASWASAYGQNGADFQTFFNDQTLAGRTLVHVDSYRQGNDIVYASIFVDQPGPLWIATYGLTTAQHQAQFNNLIGQGYRPSIISVVEDSNGVARYTGLYDQSNVGGWVALANLTSAQYITEFNNQAIAGRMLAYLNGYTINGSPRFSAIWNSNVPGTWVHRHDRTSAQFQSDFDNLTGNGLLIRNVTGYDNGGTANFAGLWTD